MSVDERPVELSGRYPLRYQLAGEPTRVSTKVNFEYVRPRKQTSGIVERVADVAASS